MMSGCEECNDLEGCVLSKEGFYLDGEGEVLSCGEDCLKCASENICEICRENMCEAG